MRFCWPQILFIVLVIVLGVGSMLSGCGKKGPLYLPDQNEQTRQAS
ncbi:MAG: lipoprotein [Pseudomonadota bacterium]|nr:lipoprotein [Pseudomonadota bacterium]